MSWLRSEGIHPGDKGLLEALRGEHGKDARKRIGGRNPLGQVQKLREPRRPGLPPVGDLHLILRPANRHEYRDGEDRLQGVQRRRMLATWVVDNSEKSAHLVNRSALGIELS